MSNKRTAVHFDSEVFLINGVYYYRGTPEGSKVQREKSLKLKEGATQKEIRDAKKSYLDSLELLGKKGNTKTENIFHEYKLHRKEELENGSDDELGFGISKATYKETVSIINNHLSPYFKSIPIVEFDQGSFNDYCKLTYKKGLNLVNHRKVFNHFLKWCVKNKYLKYRQDIEIEPKYRRARRKRVIVSVENAEKLFSKASIKLILYIALYLYQMMRNSEIRLLEWTDIDFEKDAIIIRPSSNRRRKGRVIPLNGLVKKLLLEVKKDSRSKFVFPQIVHGKINNSKPMSVGGIRKAFQTACANAGIDQKITPHDLRATGEKFMHKDKRFTDTQREKFAGANIEVQKRIYVDMDADDLRGMENVVKITAVDKLLKKRLGKKLGKND